MMLEKEGSSGMYRLSAYFMARTVGDLPMELVLPTIFTVITYWMAGLKPSIVIFFTTLFSLVYNVLVFQGLGLAIGAMVTDLKSANTLCSVIMLSFTLVGGYFVQHVSSFIAWIKHTIGLGDKGISIAALTIMLLGYRFLAYVALMRIGVTKKLDLLNCFTQKIVVIKENISRC
ncbi:hypothetical protein RND71_004660 [Anisodus tanguticus]|uniref:ABC-2 type transporter transmembrane domain-containing protein n=1 Tax=Anisodus tanguticus TaxID=243964 RepID=A0AAE1SQY9_9SOLA|nr:hypothetical protein RND71_004660 [Anisodus tanguticus]